MKVQSSRCRDFLDRLYTDNGEVLLDDKGRIRIDDWEMREDVQKKLQALLGNYFYRKLRRN